MKNHLTGEAASALPTIKQVFHLIKISEIRKKIGKKSYCTFPKINYRSIKWLSFHTD